MKKVLSILPLLTFAVVSQAVSFTWTASTTGTGASTVVFSGTTLGPTAATAYLFYLGGESILNADGTVNVAGQDGTYTPTGAPNNGKLSNRGASYDFGLNAADANGKQFAVVITTVQDGVTYVNISEFFALSGYVNGAESPSFYAMFDFSTITKNLDPVNPGKYVDTPVAGGGWFAVPVPEPATAALALAGLALLIRRRK